MTSGVEAREAALFFAAGLKPRPPTVVFPELDIFLIHGHDEDVGGEMPFQLGKFLVVAGVCLVIFGLMVMAGSKFSFFGLGRLPGDVAFKGKNVHIYLPIVTCLIVSGVLTLVMWIISFLTRR